MIKLIACDIDGTLLDDDARLSNRTKDAIIKVINQRKDVILCTGRTLFETKLFLDENNLNLNVILLNGSFMMNKEGIISNEYHIDDKLIYDIDEITKNYIVEYHCLNKTLLKCSREDFIKEFKIYQLCNQKYGKFNFDFFWRYDDNCFNHSIEDIIQENVIKIEILFVNSEDELINKLRGFSINISSGHFFDNIEITDINASKGKALLDYCQRNNIANDEVIVIGDSLNDKSMFDIFDNNVAVANAEDEIIKMAKYQTLSNNDDGVAIVLERLLENDFKCK